MSSGGYAKVFESILDSSIWSEPEPTRLVWITMLAMADAQGFVEAAVSGLARRANVRRDACEAALLTLLSPDPDSKNPENEGRRIAKVDGGWVILNHKTYRDKKGGSPDSSAERTRRYREKQAAANGNGDASQPSQTVTDRHSDEATVTNRHSASASASASENLKKEEQVGSEPAARVPCPPDLKLTEAQAANLEMNAGCPRWAQDQVTVEFVTSNLADPSDIRPPVAWQKCLAKAVAGRWSDPARRPKKPTPASTEPSNAHPRLYVPGAS